MLIGLISDTHGSAKSFQKVLDGPFKDVELILHAGDVLYHGARSRLAQGHSVDGLEGTIKRLTTPIIVARGNCDSEADERMLNIPLMSPYVFLYIDGKRIMLLHGDGRKEGDFEDLIIRFHLAVLVHGHTHIPRIRKVGAGLIVNPGTPTIPNPSSRFKKTVAILDTVLSHVMVQDIDSGETVLEGAFGQ